VKNTRSLVVGLLVILGIGDILFLIPATGTMMPDEPRPPAAIVVLSVVLGVASLAAAYGIVKGAGWAIPTAYTTRVLDILSTIPAFFMGLSTVPLVVAGLFIVLSAITIALLMRLPKARLAGT
jgi:hypothetical protein